MSSFTQYSAEEFKNTYTIREQIGSGGTSTVFRATHNRLMKDVIIKKLGEAMGDSGQQRAEVDILKNLHHPFLPQVYDFFEANGSCFTVMEYVHGTSLMSLLDQNVIFSYDQILKYSRQLCEVVSYLHSQALPVIHGDIKPANIILTSEDNICLIDFNISSVAVGGTAFTRGCSRRYSAPEQVEIYDVLKTMGPAAQMEHPVYANGIPVDKRSDVYSIGATMLHMCGGRDGEYSGLAGVINRAISHNPNDRFSDAGDMLDALLNLDSGLYSDNAEADAGTEDNSGRHTDILFGIIRFFLIITAAIGIVVMYYGYSSLDRERDERYYGYIKNMEEAREEGNPDDLARYYKLAVGMRPDNAQAYYQMAAYYYESGDYFAAIDYIYENVPEDDSLQEDEYIAGIYDIYADCFFEAGQYGDAADAWGRAIRHNDEEPSYYRNLAVAYTLNDQVAKAEEILNRAEEYGIADDGILLIRAEIKNRIGNYADAQQDYRACIGTTHDDRILYLAYIGCSEAITAQVNGSDARNASYNANIALLSQGLREVNEQYHLALLKRLADISREAFIENQDDAAAAEVYLNSAAEAYAGIYATGWMNEVEFYNYVDLYIKAGDFDSATEVQTNMENAFDNSLLAAESHAFLERQIQLGKPADQRDYTAFCRYYLAAQDIADSEGISDERLIRLAEIYREVI